MRHPNLLLAPTDPEVCDLVRQVKKVFTNLADVWRKQRPENALPGAYFSVREASYASLQSYTRTPELLRRVAGKLDIELPCHCSTQDLIGQLTEPLARLTMRDPGIIAEENKQRHQAENELQGANFEAALQSINIRSAVA